MHDKKGREVKERLDVTGKESKAMTPEERERMNKIVGLLQDEKDHEKFLELVRELNTID